MLPTCQPICPAESGITCWPKVTSGLGKRFTMPSSIIARAPWPVFFTWLEYRYDLPLPQIEVRRQDVGRSHKPGHVHIVSAGMRDRCCLPEAICTGLSSLTAPFTRVVC